MAIHEQGRKMIVSIPFPIKEIAITFDRVRVRTSSIFDNRDLTRISDS